VRRVIYEHASAVEWYPEVSRAHELWAQGVAIEEKEWLAKLEAYLQKVQLESLRDVSQSREHPGIEEPNPPSSHDYNYGQQLTQMYEILNLYMSRTGNMQGIPRPRHEADWACTDGYEFAYSPAYDEIDGVKGTAPPPTGRGIVSLKDFPEPNFSTELPPPSNGKNLPNIGISLNRIIAHPDAKSPEIRAQFTKENEERKNESLTSIEKAHIAKFGSKEAEEMVDKEHKVQVAAERAQSLQEYLKGEFHTTDLEGSYYWNEVQLAFRNHGTHWETLSQDITPLGHHYLLIHYDVQFFKSALDSHRLKVFGCVKNPVILTMAQIKEMGKGLTHSVPMVMECSGNGRAMMKPRYNQHVPWGLQAFGCYCWTGTPLRNLIDRVGVTEDCIDVVFTGYDAGLEKEKEVRYFSHALNIHDPVIDHSWLIWMNNGVDLLPEHGYPLRLMVPAWYGNVNIKWLRSIEFMPRRFKGVYQRTYSYTKTPTDNDIAVPSQELRPRAMVAPIGIPDFTTRKRTTVAGQQHFFGKCWVGGGHYRAITHVELSLDAGKSWLLCQVGPRIGINAWANFNLTLDLPVGIYQVMVRATDNLGNRQKLVLDWNWASMQDDAIQAYELTVVDSLSVIE
jgi:DMSO/TMAO reductase YedYZ molybdopterin-dependent catalytic subunit